MKKFRVKQGASISTDHHGLIRGGSIIKDDGTLKPKQIEELLRTGFLELASTPLDDVPVALPPGVTLPPALPGLQRNDDHQALDSERAMRIEVKGPVVKVESASIPNPPEGTPLSKWNLDPAALAGQPLEHLNVMVKERDPEIAAFNTVEEAIEWLSMDFRPPSTK